MRKELIKFVLFIIFSVSPCFAFDTNYIGLKVQSDNSCPQGSNTPPSNVPAECTSSKISQYKCIDVWKVTCPDTLGSAFENSVVSEVPLTEMYESQVQTHINDSYQSFLAGAAANLGCPGGSTKVGSLGASIGYVEQGSSPNTVGVTVDNYAHVYCTKGSVTDVVVSPLPIGGGIGGGAADPELLAKLDITNSHLLESKDLLVTNNNGIITIQDILTNGFGNESILLNHIASQLTGIDGVMVQTESGITVLNNSVVAGNGLIASVDGKLATEQGILTNGFSTLETGVSGLGGSLGTLNTGIDTVNSQLSGIGTGIQGINDKLAAIGGGGTINGDVTVNVDNSGVITELQTIRNDLNSGTYTGGDGSGLDAYSAGGTGGEAEVAAKFSFVGEKFNTLKTRVQSTQFVSGFQGFFHLPAGSTSVISFDGGIYGNHSYDFASWGSIFIVVKSILLVTVSYACVRILVLKGN